MREELGFERKELLGYEASQLTFILREGGRGDAGSLRGDEADHSAERKRAERHYACGEGRRRGEENEEKREESKRANEWK